MIVEYEIPGINPGSDMETPTAKGKLFPNVKVGVPDNFILIHFLCTQAVIMVPRIHISRKVAKFTDHKCDISNEYLQGVSIHYITSIHYISNQVVVVVHYIFWAIYVVVVNTNILRTTTPLQLFVQNWMKMTFLDIFDFENLRHSAVGNELRLIFILIQLSLFDSCILQVLTLWVYSCNVSFCE